MIKPIPIIQNTAGPLRDGADGIDPAKLGMLVAVGDPINWITLRVGVSVGAVAEAVSSVGLGVNVCVAVGALRLVGVGVRLNARDVEARYADPKVWVALAV